MGSSRGRPGLAAARPTRRGPAAVRPGTRGTASASTRPAGSPRPPCWPGRSERYAGGTGGRAGDVPAAVTAISSPSGAASISRRSTSVWSSRDRRTGARTQRHPVRRAYLLAVVAAVDAAAQGGPVLEREHARRLQQPGQARRASSTPGSTRAPVGQAPRHRRHGPQPSATGGPGQRGVGDHGAEDEPRAASGQQDIAVFAVPAQTGPRSCGPVHQGVVVGHHPRRPTCLFQQVGQLAQGRTQVGVVVPPCVTGHPAPRPDRRRWRRPRPAVPPGAHDQGGRPGQHPPRVSRRAGLR